MERDTADAVSDQPPRGQYPTTPVTPFETATPLGAYRTKTCAWNVKPTRPRLLGKRERVVGLARRRDRVAQHVVRDELRAARPSEDAEVNWQCVRGRPRIHRVAEAEHTRAPESGEARSSRNRQDSQAVVCENRIDKLWSAKREQG